jgi:myo-inositol catabolism protein IolS
MRYRRLGQTELDVSVIGIGTWQLGGLWGKQFAQAEVNAIFSRARELGINFIDTAECYGDHLAEQFIGNAMAGRREHWIIATKFGHNPGNNLGDENFSAAQVKIQLESSLRALRTDYIDVYQIHSAKQRYFENDELWTMLDKQVEAGKVRHLGNSVFVPQTEQQMSKSRQYGINVVQTPYNLVSRQAENLVFPTARQEDLGVIVRTPLAMGYLTGKYRPGHAFPQGDVRSIMWTQDKRDKGIIDALAALKQKPKHVEPATWAVAWCLRTPPVATVIPGIKSVEQLNVCAAAADLDLRES